MATAARTGRTSSFSRNPSTFSSSSSSSPSLQQHSGVRLGPNAAAFVSSGLPDLDRILGGGFRLGSLVMVMEDADAAHHLSLLSNFMSQGVVHHQPLLFASPSKESAELYAPVSLSSSKDEKQDGELKIAFQYRKYAQQPDNNDIKQEFSNDFDQRKPLSRDSLVAQSIDCVAIQDSPNLAVLHDRCSSFLSKLPRNDESNAGRIAIQSLCAPQCGYTEMDWDVVSFIRSLRAMLRSSNAVAVITFPNSFLRPSFSKRWQHLADTLLSVRAIPDDDKDLEKLLTGYEDMVGFLHVHKVAQINSQVPVILEATTYSIKVKRRSRCKWLVLERLNQAPVDGSSGTSYATTGSCAKGSSLDF